MECARQTLVKPIQTKSDVIKSPKNNISVDRNKDILGILSCVKVVFNFSRISNYKRKTPAMLKFILSHSMAQAWCVRFESFHKSNHKYHSRCVRDVCYLGDFDISNCQHVTNLIDSKLIAQPSLHASLCFFTLLLSTSPPWVLIFKRFLTHFQFLLLNATMTSTLCCEPLNIIIGCVVVSFSQTHNVLASICIKW